MTDSFTEAQLMQFVRATRGITALAREYDSRIEAAADDPDRLRRIGDEFAATSEGIILAAGLDQRTYDEIDAETQRDGALWQRLHDQVTAPEDPAVPADG
ncbi:DUF4168 domain-containing protein [Nocardia brevicatena]|uniref:DUF4168 domain-containing protein n=1 Tax=Nocardia brevicatena TaxID=37327 RepID=UPI00031F4ADF|nr:DUF4168 domain-containing protein [Nocardia brevicatena]